MSPPDFEALLRGARAGDESAFRHLWRSFNAPLVRYLRVLAGADDAEDLASTTWMEVVRGLDRFEGGESEFRAWLFTIGRHRFLDFRRNQSRRPKTVMIDLGPDPVDPSGDPERIVEERRATEEALGTIATLPVEQADVVMLRVVAGLDVAAVAEIVGKKPGTVRVMTHRALKRLAQSVSADGDQGRPPGSDDDPQDGGNEGGTRGA